MFYMGYGWKTRHEAIIGQPRADQAGNECVWVNNIVTYLSWTRGIIPLPLGDSWRFPNECDQSPTYWDTFFWQRGVLRSQ